MMPISSSVLVHDALPIFSGVFAGGDAVTGAATVITAMGAGKVAAAGIDKYVRTKHGLPVQESAEETPTAG
jgi:hypothetical protein